MIPALGNWSWRSYVCFKIGVSPAGLQRVQAEVRSVAEKHQIA